MLAVGGGDGCGSGGRFERAESGEGGEEFVCPGPGVREVEGALASGAGDASGDVEEPAAEPLGLGEFEFPAERELSEPGEQVLGEQRELEPGPVGRECLEGEPAEAEFL